MNKKVQNVNFLSKKRADADNYTTRGRHDHY